MNVLFSLALCLCAACGTVAAQEAKRVYSSSILGASLPAGAQRLFPNSVPAEVDQTLDKIVSAGNGKLVRGETEVIVWTGADYKKSKSPQIINSLRAAWKNGGWAFELGGEENGMAIFSLLKDGDERRAVIGFYGSDETAFVLALTELHQAGSVNTVSNPNTEEPQTEEPTNQPSVKSGGSLRSLVGKWEKKSTTGGTYDRATNRYLGSSGNYESYEIFADGRVAYSSLISVQQGGCNLSAFIQNQGRAAVSGSQVTFNLAAGTVDRKDTCNSSGDYKRQTNATNYTYTWTVGDDGYGNTQLCLTEADGKQFCYRKVK